LAFLNQFLRCVLVMPPQFAGMGVLKDVDGAEGLDDVGGVAGVDDVGRDAARANQIDGTWRG